MEIRYFPDTDSLYISLTPKASIDSEEIAPGFVVDYDEEGRVVGIDIDSRARELVELSDIKLTGLGVPVLRWQKPDRCSLTGSECINLWVISRFDLVRVDRWQTGNLLLQRS